MSETRGSARGGRLWRAAALVAAGLVVAGYAITVNPAEGATEGTGENSAFSEAGIERIEQERAATIDLRGPLTADDLGAGGSAPRDVDVRGEEPIQLTALGAEGDLVVDAEVIRVLVGAGGEVQSIALFEGPQDAAALADRLLAVGPQVGLDGAALQSVMQSLGGGESVDHWLHGGQSLGFTVGLHPVHDPADGSVLEYQLTPPS